MKPNDQSLHIAMSKRSLLILTVLMNRFHPNEKGHLMEWLSPAEKKNLELLSVSSEDLEPIYHFRSQLDHIHYSWIEDALANTSPFWKTLIIASLSLEQRESLRASTAIPLSAPMKSLMQSQLCEKLKTIDHCPKEYLPTNEFSSLLEWNKENLLYLIDFLGLYDLATEVRSIVNTQDLKSIYSCLNAKQFHFLKLCLRKKDKVTSPKLELKPNQLDRKKLKKLLHLRGLLRLGRALCGQPYDFVWTLSHSLDIGRGKAILKDYRSEKDIRITPLLQQQVVQVMEFLKKEVIRE